MLINIFLNFQMEIAENIFGGLYTSARANPKQSSHRLAERLKRLGLCQAVNELVVHEQIHANDRVDKHDQYEQNADIKRGRQRNDQGI